MVTGCHAQTGVAIHNLGALGGDGNVGQQARHQTCAHRWAVHGAHDGFVAVDEVVDQVPRFFPHAGAHLEVLGHVLHQIQVAAARKAHALAAQHRATHAVVPPHIAPYFAQFFVTFMPCRGQLAVECFHLDVEHVVMGATAADGQGLVSAVVDGFHGCEWALKDVWLLICWAIVPAIQPASRFC